MSSKVVFVPDIAEINQYRGWTGPIGRSFSRLEKETTWRQKRLVHRDTGTLQKSVTSKHVSFNRGLEFQSGSWTVSYAIIHELGSRPHIILPRQSPVLVFFWPKVGKVIFSKKVMHPGTRAYHPMSEGLDAAMRMWDRSG